MSAAAYRLETGPNGASARFSHDGAHRFLLRRFLNDDPANVARLIAAKRWRTCVFVMLNPSTADAFKLDPTVKRCVCFAQRWGFDVLEVVNLFAFRSPKPSELRRRIEKATEQFDLEAALEFGGFGRVNDQHIISACANAERVIAAWGNHGADPKLATIYRQSTRSSHMFTQSRGAFVRDTLEGFGVELQHLGLNQNGSPKHPLGRGKGWIPDSTDPVLWRR